MSGGGDVPAFPAGRPGALYYVQDRRGYVGNSVSWWAKDHKGYVCDIRKAHVFTEDELRRITRETDVVWPKDYIDQRLSHHVDVQHLDRGSDGPSIAGDQERPAKARADTPGGE